MKIFKDLIIKGEVDTLKSVLQDIIVSLPSGWNFMSDLVNDYSRNVSKAKDEVGCFQSPEIADEKVLVWLVIWDKELKVVNIVPTVSHSLTHDQYNNVLDKFYNDCVSKVISNKPVETLLTEGAFDIIKIAGKKTFDALNKWESSCNHSTGNTNPFDFERWANFVCVSFNEKSKLTPDLLKRWLAEERNWKDDELTTKLVLDYEYGLSILEHYVENY